MTITTNATVRSAITRDQLLGCETHLKVSDLGVAQRRHDYPPELLATILTKALALKQQASDRRHLGLRLIRGAHTLIPEVNDLITWPGRLQTLSDIAKEDLEPYPVSVIASTVTFMGASPKDGVVDWHADGIPMTEIIPLQITDDATGGELTVFRGNYEAGLARLKRGECFTNEEILKFPHRLGHSTLAQLMRVLHSSGPMPTGARISLNLNLRSRTRPYIDDNPMYYLGADNPGFEWVGEYVDDVRNRQLPAYLAAQR
jgi:hypothetical protein